MSLDERGELLAGRQRRQLRRPVRPRRRSAARQRQDTPDAEGAQRQAATLAHHQCDARAVLQPAAAQPPLHAARRRQRPRRALRRTSTTSSSLRASAPTPCSRRPIAPGSTNVLRWVPTERGYGSTFNRPSEEHGAIETVADAPVTPEPIPAELRTIEPLDTRRREAAHARPHDRDHVDGRDGRQRRAVWKANPFDIALGDTEVWRIVNNTDFSHPFHLHGYFFQVQDDARVLEWKDTVNVPTKSELTIAVRFDDRPGSLDVSLPHPRPRRGRHDGPPHRARSDAPLPAVPPAVPPPLRPSSKPATYSATSTRLPSGSRK